MVTLNQGEKRVSLLTVADFASHPIWTWADEDGDTVVPLDYSGALPDDHDALFVACEFFLSDGIRIDGVLSLRVSDRRVYLLSYPRDDGTFFDLPLQPELNDLVTREQLADYLQKPLKHIFPITYSAPFVFNDGRPLIGQVE